MILLHNPRCSKSRQALAALEAHGFAPTIRRYLDEPLSKAEVLALLAKLKLAPLELVRQKEELWRELTSERSLSEAEIVDLLVQYPKLIERPILIHQNHAAIGRPLENLLRIIN